MRKSVIISLILMLLIAHPAFGETWEENVPHEKPVSETSLSLLLDRYFSPQVGAEALYSGVQIYKKLDDTLLSSTENNISISMVSLRLAKLLFLELPLASTAWVTQHEVFGHGARGREFHLTLNYRIRPFSGSTGYLSAQYNALHSHEKLAFITGGIEASALLAKRLRDGWLETNTLDSREALLYVLTNFDQTRYIMSMRNDKTFSDGHDIKAYVKELNAWFGRSVVTSRSLRVKTILDYVDPYYFYSLYSLVQYASVGTQKWQYPMLEWGNYRYLPALRLALAPYGVEYQWHNYLHTPERMIQAVLRYGKTSELKSIGFGIEATRLFEYANIILDGKVHLWRQPKLFTPRPALASQKWGGAFSVIGRYPLPDWPSLQLVGILGYKSTGFLPGEPLKQTPIIKIGMRALF